MEKLKEKDNVDEKRYEGKLVRLLPKNDIGAEGWDHLRLCPITSYASIPTIPMSIGQKQSHFLIEVKK